MIPRTVTDERGVTSLIFEEVYHMPDGQEDALKMLASAGYSIPALTSGSRTGRHVTRKIGKAMDEL